MATIFWVEDQSHWIKKFSAVLEAEDFDGKPNSLAIYHFAEAARQKIALTDKESPPDVALLDARMNGNDRAGFTVSNALRKKWPNLPIIYLSEHAGTDIERAALEQFAAADFIAKHQNNIEQVLCWRIRAVLRQVSIDSDLSITPDVITSGELSIDLTSWNVYWMGQRLMNPGNARRPLAPTPRKLLRELVESSPRPLTAGQIAHPFLLISTLEIEARHVAARGNLIPADLDDVLTIGDLLPHGLGAGEGVAALIDIG
jgi:DNA-binding response OmpR family regulator